MPWPGREATDTRRPNTPVSQAAGHSSSSAALPLTGGSMVGTDRLNVPAKDTFSR